MKQIECDVLVIGTGIAGTVAALAAQERGASVIVLDKVSRERAGGSSRMSGGGFRAPRENYSADDMYSDVMLVTKGRASAAITRHVVDNAASAMAWLQTMGMIWVDETKAGRPDLHGRRIRPYRAQPLPYELSGVHQLGFGNGAMHLLHQTLFDRVDVKFETKAENLLLDGQRRIAGVRAYDAADGFVEFRAPVVILGTGGYQANVDWRVRYFGRSADAWILRGSKYSTGDGIRMAMDIGGAPAGQWGGVHTPIIDARSPKVECGETNINQYQYTVMLNSACERFLDEGEDFGDRTIIRYGNKVLSQPDGIAYLVFDQKVVDLVKCNIKTWLPSTSNDLGELATNLGLDSGAFRQAIEKFNASVQPGGFDPDILDGKRTAGLTPAKSNWALPVDTPPYYAFRVTAGITYGFGGIKIDEHARVIDNEDRPIHGLYAAGEMAGGLFYDGYPGTSSLSFATVLARTAGILGADQALARGDVRAN